MLAAPTRHPLEYLSSETGFGHPWALLPGSTRSTLAWSCTVALRQSTRISLFTTTPDSRVAGVVWRAGVETLGL